MNKVLVTGLALGKEIGLCDACNFDYTWLHQYPSILIWADKILLSPLIWENVASGEPTPDPVLNKSLQLIFNIVKEEGVIEIEDPSNIVSNHLAEAIAKEAINDRKVLTEAFPKAIQLDVEEGVPSSISIDGYMYCAPLICSIYTSLVLAKSWNAQCLFNPLVFNYLQHKFSLSDVPKEGQSKKMEGFQSVFESYLPSIPILPSYVLSKETQCSDCRSEKKCKESYLSSIEVNTKKLLKLRDYDEIHQLKEVVEDIIGRRNELGGIIRPTDILHDFRDRERKLRRRMMSLFPKIKRFTNITTILSIPMAFTGIASNLPFFTISGAAMIGVSQAANQLINFLSSKYSWVGFLNKDIDLHK